ITTGECTADDIMNMMATPAIEKITRYLPLLSTDEAKAVLAQERAYYKAIATKRDLLFADTHTVIPALAKRFALGIITNSTHTAIDAAFPKELQRHFEAIVTYEEVRRPKPAPDSLLVLAKKWRLEPAECAYVGDARSDMVFAKNAGVKAIGITTGECTADELREAGAEKVINRLADLLEL
ncbi:MAG: HAD family hydrolase, partial [Candidatus Diapherotrites archaeon]|nr:HAD family hydrolase [Candidatus Diapherotrites archaeon]